MEKLIVTELTENLINELDKHHLDTGNDFRGYNWKQYRPAGYVVFKQQSDLSWELDTFTYKSDYHDSILVSNGLCMEIILKDIDYSPRLVTTFVTRSILDRLLHLNLLTHITPKSYDKLLGDKYSLVLSYDSQNQSLTILPFSWILYHYSLLPEDLFIFYMLVQKKYYNKVNMSQEEISQLKYETYQKVTSRIQELNSKTFDIEKDSKYSFYYSVDNDIIFYDYYKSTIQSPIPLLMSSKEVAEQIKRELPNELDILFNPKYKF